MSMNLTEREKKELSLKEYKEKSHKHDVEMKHHIMGKEEPNEDLD